jgi:pSer/pThr/pTyr-binding forkhead associated (FHA) protein
VCGTSVDAAQALCPTCGRDREKPAAWDAARWHASDPGKSDVPLPLKPDTGPPVIGTVRSVWDLEDNKEYLVELRSGGFVLPWQLDRSGYTIGRDANMKIRIDDPSVGRYHMFMVRLPCGWLAMNPAPNLSMEVNGWPTKQHVLRSADLVRLGSAWLTFAAPATPGEPLAPIPGRWIERVGPKAQTVKGGGSSSTQVQPATTASCVLEIAGGAKYISRGQPLRIGTSPLCEVRLDDMSAAPVQALVAWQSDGPHLTNVTGGLVRLMSGDIFADRLLRDGDLLQIGKTPVRARVEGDPLAPGRLIAAAVETSRPRLAMTILNGNQRGQSAIIPAGQPVTLGRLAEGDLILASDPFVSRRHLELVATDDEINIRDLGRRSGFFVNQTHFADTGVVRLGDVLVVGKTSILVHHELDVE